MKNLKDIKVILYDADGVINNASMSFSDILDKKYGLTFEQTKNFFKGPFIDCEEGKKDMREVLPDFLTKWNWPGSLDDFIDIWFKSEHTLEDVILEDVARLRKQGIACYVATNQEAHRASYMFEQMGFKNHFNGMYASAQLGALKPKAEFFNGILHELKVLPENVLFWDDAQENVDGAEELGIHAEFFSNIETYKSIMKEIYGL